MHCKNDQLYYSITSTYTIIMFMEQLQSILHCFPLYFKYLDALYIWNGLTDSTLFNFYLYGNSANPSVPGKHGVVVWISTPIRKYCTGLWTGCSVLITVYWKVVWYFFNMVFFGFRSTMFVIYIQDTV